MCGTRASKRCPNCKTPYCSRMCQAADWRAGHKGSCAAIAKGDRDARVAAPVDELDEVLAQNVCPLCRETMSGVPEEQMYYSCCSKIICDDCDEMMVEGEEDTCPFCGMENPIDSMESIARTRKRVALGDRVAQYELAMMHETGRPTHGVEKNDAEALKLLILSANQGWADAEYNIGCRYAVPDPERRSPTRDGRTQAGRTTDSDAANALKLWESAAAKGHVKARSAAAAVKLLGAENQNTRPAT